MNLKKDLRKSYNSFYFLQDTIIKKKNEMDFQQICDILYYNKLVSKNMIEWYKGKICIEFIVHFNPLLNIIDEEYPLFINSKPEKFESYEKKLCILYNDFKKLFSSNPVFRDYNIITNLYSNLLIEISFTFDKKVSFENIENLEALKQNIVLILNEDLTPHPKKYFVDAYNEILGLEPIVYNCLYFESPLPEYDMAREFGLIISLNSTYGEFVKYISKLFDQEASFILKYINIRNLKMSSGERALQNLCSWLNILPYFNKIDVSMPKSLKTNLLLLIDEFDLYLHPEWQRHMLKYFIDIINSQFKDYKVQIIFATHSPIMLSDIPNKNIIYLENKDGKATTYNINRETFAANIYNLLNDGFYLDNTIGDFAIFTIENTIDIIKRNVEYDETYVEYIINLIGEPIIKEKIKELYAKLKHTDKLRENLNDHDSSMIYQTIDLLEHQVIQLKNQIALLKETLDD